MAVYTSAHGSIKNFERFLGFLNYKKCPYDPQNQKEISK